MSDELTPDIIAAQFLRQYDLYLQGEEVSQVYTAAQLMTMIGAMEGDPENMKAFFVSTSEFIKVGMKLNSAEEAEIVEAIREFYTSIIGFMAPIIFLQAQRIETIQEEEEVNDIWGNLDFPMPDHTVA